MRKSFVVCFLCIFGYFTQAQIPQTRCSTMEHLVLQKASDPALEGRMDAEKMKFQKWIEENEMSAKTNTTITIPVVVHVIYKTTSQNISDTQVHSQIDILNKDYGRTNTDTTHTPAPFKSQAVNTGIQFCLASRDVNGDWTNGIIRKQTSVTQFGVDDAMKFSSSEGDDAWDPEKYFNIWVCNLDPSLVGYAEFPYENSSPSSSYGVVINYLGFGKGGTAKPPYNLGRTATHEIGHCFNLEHIWGDDGGDCSATDYVDDTPDQSDYSIGCNTFPYVDACTSGNGIMFMNYMDYSDDVCMNMFTEGQANRMIAAINMYYPSLITSDGCQLPTTIKEKLSEQQIGTYPNPVSGILTMNINTISPADLQINIYNTVGEIVASSKAVSFTGGSITMDLSDRPNGLYFVRVMQESGSVTKKIILLK